MKYSKKLFSILCGLIFCLSQSTYADGGYYVSEKLNTYTRAGDSENFRINGSVMSGEEVTLLEVNPDTRYARIKTAKGKIGWISQDLISTTPSCNLRLPVLEEQLKTISEELERSKLQLTNLTDSREQEQKQDRDNIQALERQNKQLSEELVQVKNKLVEAQEKLDSSRLDMILKWCMYGGGIAGAGLLTGLLLPYILPRRRSRTRDRWMN